MRVSSLFASITRSLGEYYIVHWHRLNMTISLYDKIFGDEVVHLVYHRLKCHFTVHDYIHSTFISALVEWAQVPNLDALSGILEVNRADFR